MLNIYKVFDLFDVNHSGDIDLNEFYLLTCMLIAIKVLDPSSSSPLYSFRIYLVNTFNRTNKRSSSCFGIHVSALSYWTRTTAKVYHQENSKHLVSCSTLVPTL